MLQSMTGYGEAQLEAEGISFVVEIKSLNNRFLKTVIKLPDALAFVEGDIERILRQSLGRGTVMYALHMRHVSSNSAADINQAAVRSYLTGLEQIATFHSGAGALNIDLTALLQLPGVCQPHQYSPEQHQWFLQVVKDLTATAVEHLQKMRAEEGANLVADLHQNCQAITDNLTAVGKLTDTVVDNYRRRIQQRVNSMLAEAKLKLDEQMLIREVALFAERCDINEELLRLGSHLEQFRQACQQDHQAGRRLDFLTQEMVREANTISSKANDADISHHIVEIKVAIDRLKEQVQNVL